MAVGLAIILARSDVSAFVPRRDGAGLVLFRSGSTVTFVFNSRNPATQHDAWRAAMATLNETAGSALSVIEATNSPTFGDPVIGDGINTVALMDSNDWPFYSPEDTHVVVKCVDDSGEVLEDDVYFNHMDFKLSSGLNGSYTHERVHDMESVALAAFLQAAANLDHSPRHDHVMFADLPYGSLKRSVTATETAALRALFPEGGPREATLGGTVTRSGQGVSYAYVCASGPVSENCALTDETGSFTIRHLNPGSYRVAVFPTTTNPSYVLSPAYRANDPMHVNFQALEHPLPVIVTAGQNVTDVDFAVSTTASAPDPNEAREPVPLPTDGTPVITNTWPAADEDRFVVATSPGQCLVVGTEHTGVAAATVSDGLALSSTSLAVHDGDNVLASNQSRNAAQGDPRSLLVVCEGAVAREVELVVSQRQSSAAGAGYYFDVFGKLVKDPPEPVIGSVDPREATAGDESFVVIVGQGFMPGAQIEVGGRPASLESVDDCDESFRCSAIMAAMPGDLDPGIYEVTVINPDGQSFTLPRAFEYLALPNGPVYDMYWWGAWPFPATLSDATGLCWGDYDGDGDHDLFRAGDDGFSLLRHDGDATFTDVSGSDGIPGSDTRSPMFSCAWGDVEGDGDLDLYVTMEPIAVSDEDRLYVNHLAETGRATFSEEAASRGITSPSGDVLTKPVFLDYDRDGDLDIFVASGSRAVGTPYQPNRLYRNVGTGHFTDVAFAAGVDLGATDHRTVDVIVGDFSGDGWDDLYLVNLSTLDGHDGSDALFVNDRGGGFLEATASAGIDSVDNCNNGQAADFDHDGRLDIVCFLSSKSGDPPARLYLNNGDGTFHELAAAAGLTYPTLPERWCSSMTLLDHDLDGDTDIYLGCRSEPGAPSPGDELDLLLSNQLLETGLMFFSDVTASSGLADAGNYDFRTDVVTAVDFDGDMDPDIFKSGDPSFDLAWGGNQNNPAFPADPSVRFTKDAIAVRLDGTLSNPHGIGAKIKVVRKLGLPEGVPVTEDDCLTVAPPAQEARTRWMLTDGGNQSPYEVVFAFDRPEAPAYEGAIDCVIVDWPSGHRQVFTTLALNTTVRLVEGAGSVTVVNVIPDFGPQSGGQPVTVTGFGFESGAKVFFGAYEAHDCATADPSTITCTTPPWQVPGLVDVTVVNPDQTSDVLAAAFTFTGSLVVETVDPNPDLLVGPDVSSATDILIRPWAREVVGMATDGASRVVLRVQVAGPGDTVTFKLRNQLGTPVAPDWGYGTLYEPGRAPADVTALTVRAKQASDGSWWALAVLLAPRDARAIDAVIESEPPLFVIAKTEPMFIEAAYCAGGSCPRRDAQVVQRQFDLYRPPIALLGGAYSGDAAYDWFGPWLPFYSFPGLQDLEDVFHIFPGNFSGISDRHLSEIVSYWDDAIVDGAVRGMRFAEDIAVTRAFVIAHSTGAAVTRMYINDQGDLPYLRHENFLEGDIVGFISLVGLHTGSVIAKRIWDLLTTSPAAVAHEARFFAEMLGFPIDRGIIEDTRYDSAVVRNLPGSSLMVPVHAIWASGGTGFQTGVLWSASPYRLRHPVKILDHFGVDLNDLFLGDCQHDGVLFALTQQGQLNYPEPPDPSDLTELEYSSPPGPLIFSFHWTVSHEWPASDAVVKLLTDRIYGPTTHEEEWCFWDPGDNWFCRGFPDNALLPESAFAGCDELVTSEPVDRPARSTLSAPGSPTGSAGGLVITTPADGTYVPPGEAVPVEVAAIDGYEPDRVSVIASTGDYATDTDGPPYTFELTVPHDAIGAITVVATGLRAGNTDIRRSPAVHVNVDLGGIGLTGLEITPNPLIISTTSSYTRLSISANFTDGIRRQIDPSDPAMGYFTADETVATVDPGGFVRGHGIGETTIEVSYGGQTASASVFVYSVPLVVTLDRDHIAWPTQASAVGYDVVAGSIEILRRTGGNFTAAVTECLGDDVTEAEMPHVSAPNPGQGYFYVVRSVISEENARTYNAEPGTGQVGDRDPEIDAAGSACP